MNVKEIGDRLDGMTAAEIRTVREYEKRNKNRETLIEQFDRKLKACFCLGRYQVSAVRFQNGPTRLIREKAGGESPAFRLSD